MDANQVGKKLVDLCRTGKNMDAIDTLYSPNVVSIEAMGNEQMPQKKKKGKQRSHSARVEGPFPTNLSVVSETHPKGDR